jgi:membrane-associated protease RseP (regulator of RpoE activity)
LHLTLFLVTFFTTLFAGSEWTSGKISTMELSELFKYGLTYSILILSVLALHEFAHYFAAKFHNVEATLPYFIPFPPIAGFLNFGTMGAVIKTKSVVQNNKAMFDIGIAGPIASFFCQFRHFNLWFCKFAFGRLPFKYTSGFLFS